MRLWYSCMIYSLILTDLLNWELHKGYEIIIRKLIIFYKLLTGLQILLIVLRVYILRLQELYFLFRSPLFFVSCAPRHFDF